MAVNEKLQRLLRVCEVPEDRIASMNEKEAYSVLAGEYLYAFRIAYYAAIVMFTFLFGLDWALLDAIIPELGALHFWIGLMGTVVVTFVLMLDHWVPALMAKGIIRSGRVTMLMTLCFAALVAAYVPQFVVDLVDYCVLHLFGVDYVPSRWD